MLSKIRDEYLFTIYMIVFMCHLIMHIKRYISIGRRYGTEAMATIVAANVATIYGKDEYDRKIGTFNDTVFGIAAAMKDDISSSLYDKLIDQHSIYFK